MQPPPRGCVLKQDGLDDAANGRYAAAFSRLCVETNMLKHAKSATKAAAFSRLCVETIFMIVSKLE